MAAEIGYGEGDKLGLIEWGVKSGEENSTDEENEDVEDMEDIEDIEDKEESDMSDMVSSAQ
jgi:hypothetical protein